MKNRLLLSFLLLFGSLMGAVAQDTPKYSYDDLVPNETQAKVEQFATQFLMNYSYRKIDLNDDFSRQVWKEFLNNVDRSKAYFTQADIDGFKKYETTIDEALLSGDLEAPFAVFNLYRKKYRERHGKILALINADFDYTKDESYNPDREDAPWATSEAELDEVWRKIIKSQLLAMKLNDSDEDSVVVDSDSAIVASLTKRYNMYENRMAKLRSEDVFQTYMNSFTESIDPHTSYMIPSNAASFNIDMSQSLEGIGATLQNDGEFVKIVDIIPGGPLFKTGQATKGDRILAVGQADEPYQDIVGWLTDDAVKIIRGPKGTKVRLKLLAENAPLSSNPREINIIREKIKLEDAVATAEIIPVKSGKKTYKIGLIDLPMFYRDFEGARTSSGDFQSSTKDVSKFIEDFKTQKVDAVVIDLRNNGGGALTEAIDLTGLFIEKGPVVQRRSYRRGTDVEDDKNPMVAYDGPLVVLQNRFSASASEIFAGAIQDYDRGLIIGERSFGKATVQQLVDFDQYLSSRVASNNKQVGKADGKLEEKEKYGQLKLTTEKFYRITGRSNQRIGVQPDVAFPTPFDANETGESSYPTALPNDEIEPTRFRPTEYLSAAAITKLNTEFSQRMAKDSVWQQVLPDFTAYRNLNEKETYSLNIDERRAEKETTDAYFKSIKKLTKSAPNESHANDLYLNEALSVAVDLIKK